LGKGIKAPYPITIKRRNIMMGKKMMKPMVKSKMKPKKKAVAKANPFAKKANKKSY
jgi:hypothetical protein